MSARQLAMVMDLNKCIGCQTCTVSCKTQWTNRNGREYMHWNNVETRPGAGYPAGWEQQGGGFDAAGALQEGTVPSRSGGYGTPWDFNLDEAALGREIRPDSEPRHGPNWDEDVGGGDFPNAWHFYLPRICNHCSSPACLAACPRGAIFKREQDGVVLVDQERCEGLRYCVAGCPYKKIYFNWQSGKAEKCIFCYPRIEAGQPTVCSETCVGRIRYLGVLLYDADGIERAASVEDPKELYEAQLALFLDPNDPAVVEQARKDGVPDNWLEAAKASPTYKMAVDWKVAFPLHPEYRTLPMVWYVPPLSPISAAANSGQLGANGEIPDVSQLRIPLKYLANLLTAGDEEPVKLALERMLAMRAFMRARHVEKREDAQVLAQVGLSTAQVEDMYRYMAIANYEDRFVIPTSHREQAEDAYDLRGACGFSFGNGCSGGTSEASLFGGKKRVIPLKALSAKAQS